MKERDLERAEVAKAAMQTDEAETTLMQLKKEFTTYKLNMDQQVWTFIYISKIKQNLASQTFFRIILQC